MKPMHPLILVLYVDIADNFKKTSNTVGDDDCVREEKNK
jgi:hypothetical protein